MAPTLFTPSSSFHEHDKPNLEELLISIDEYILELVANAETWCSLKSRLTSQLKIDFLEFSQHSVFSNLYWGIESIGTAIQSTWPESWLINAERMLQVPALMEDDGITAGIPNNFLVSSSYFYLSVVSKLQGDQWQTALHFLHSLLVSPKLFRTEIAPRFYETFFHQSTLQVDEDEVVRRKARRYKHCLTYYQVMLYGHKDKDAQRETDRDRDRDRNRNIPYHLRRHEASSIEEPINLYKLRRPGKYFKETRSLARVASIIKDPSQLETSNQRSGSSIPPGKERAMLGLQRLHQHNETDIPNFFPDPIKNLNTSFFNFFAPVAITTPSFDIEDAANQTKLDSDEYQVVRGTMSTTLKNCSIQNDIKQSTTRKLTNSASRVHVCQHSEQDSTGDLLKKLESMISEHCFSELLGKWDEDYAVKLTTSYAMLNKRTGEKYCMLKNVILDQLIAAISSSKEKTGIRASISILATIVSANRIPTEDIKKKGLNLSDLASALQRNVHEAAIMIHLMKPSPTEIRRLELLPALVEVVSSSISHKLMPAAILLTPHVASMMIIEVLVTAFDYATNNMHLSGLSAPRFLSGLLNIARNENLNDCIVVGTIVVKCMQFDGHCRKHVTQITPIAPFINLLQSNDKRAKFVALEFFHEILRVPRSSSINLLQKIRKEGILDIMNTLMLCIQELQSDYQLLAANLMLQLNALEKSSGNKQFTKAAMEALLVALTSEDGSAAQILSAFILSNLGGTYAWTGEPYTAAWLVKKAGLTSLYHRNMIRNFGWLDQSLQDSGIDVWCSKIARNVIEIGQPVFRALEMGLKSKTKKVSRDCLKTVAWLGFEISKSTDNIKYLACEILLDEIEQLLHPGLELEERLLACLCIYNYVSGKGMQKLIRFSEGVRESLRRFSDMSWMAEELHKVTNYYLPNKSRISCVHTQILEMHQNYNGAVTALIYYKGLLYSGHSDGSIKVWDLKKHSATLLWDIREHKKAVTCFSLFEPGECLLSGSTDRTIRIWQMVERKVESIEVITTKTPIQKLEACGKNIFAITQSHKMKLLDLSQTVKGICKGKSVRCMKVVRGKIYIGCGDSSIQELTIANNRQREIKAPRKSWRIQNKPINSIVVYKDWLYCSTSTVEGANIKEWRKHYDPQISITVDKGTDILATGVVEDFLYLNSSSSRSTLQIWLRSTQQKVGRLAAGSKITSILTANDIVLCGTEAGQIKGWIPL